MFLKKIKIFSKADTFTRKGFWIIVGIIIGYIISGLISKAKDDLLILLLGGALGVLLQEFVDFLRIIIRQFNNTKIIRNLLGDISKEKCVVYIDPLDRRDISQSPVRRDEPDKLDPPLIRGTRYVLGDSDAFAMAFVLSLIEEATSSKFHPLIERASLANNKWGTPAVCIGAHNAKTREIMGKFSNVEYNFFHNYQFIIKSNEPNGDGFIRCVSPRKMGDSSIVDYGLIIKTDDQFHPDKKTLIVIAGIGENGTAGAAYFLKNSYKELPWEENNFNILIEVPSGYQSGRIVNFEEVSGFYKINEG